MMFDSWALNSSASVACNLNAGVLRRAAQYGFSSSHTIKFQGPYVERHLIAFMAGKGGRLCHQLWERPCFRRLARITQCLVHIIAIPRSLWANHLQRPSRETGCGAVAECWSA
jgi:hypothetical protein